MGSGRIAALAVSFVVVAHVASAQGRTEDAPAKPPATSDKLVYADFETVDGGRPVSARGGWVQVNPDSTVHVAEQPSPTKLLPSSHASPDNRMPSPHLPVQLEVSSAHSASHARPAG